MKKILIVGANSYIGTSLENFLKKWPNEYYIETVDLIKPTWKDKDFTGLDVVFHVSGIAHIKETKNNGKLYFDVNRDLTLEVAAKAKKEGVKQYIFLSSMSIYGLNTGIITKETIPSPKTNYGKSKIEAEAGLNKLSSDSFKITILRPPMVYGNGCRGNYNSIIKLVKKFIFFPKVNNKRSMIHIDNLCSFVKKCVDEELIGLYYPQNAEYVNTSNMAKNIGLSMNKKIYLSYILGFFVLCLKPFSKKVRKAFGNLIYKDTEDFNFDYCIHKEN